jgi:post-segregation antitoxin (ccd killing protein)
MTLLNKATNLINNGHTEQAIEISPRRHRESLWRMENSEALAKLERGAYFDCRNN